MFKCASWAHKTRCDFNSTNPSFAHILDEDQVSTTATPETPPTPQSHRSDQDKGADLDNDMISGTSSTQEMSDVETCEVKEDAADGSVDDESADVRERRDSGVGSSLTREPRYASKFILFI